VGAVDWLILTHNHQDHAGGAAAVAQILGVKQALLKPGGAEPAILRLRQAMHEKGLKDTDEIDEIRIDGVRIKLIHIGDVDEVEATKKGSGRNPGENARSTVAHIEYGRHSFLLTGDLESESEKRIVQNGVPASTVLKVGHHGSKLSSQSDFLARVVPQYAVISVGADNRYGHPAPETVRRLQEWPIQLYRTDRDGAVVFSSDGEKLTVAKTVH
jgi:competence protein ComEC